MNNFENAFEEEPCPTCGRPLRKYEVYEIKVAKWLLGKLPASGEPDFDVWQCEPFPSLTF